MLRFGKVCSGSANAVKLSVWNTDRWVGDAESRQAKAQHDKPFQKSLTEIVGTDKITGSSGRAVTPTIAFAASSAEGPFECNTLCQVDKTWLDQVWIPEVVVQAMGQVKQYKAANNFHPAESSGPKSHYAGGRRLPVHMTGRPLQTYVSWHQSRKCAMKESEETAKMCSKTTLNERCTRRVDFVRRA
ncbi:hypothetical protein HPB48_010471 [Haemaphysalis longicornis]|uniref:Uncharacterized protein n=1 Tax=Haemaphysalis longicornis TaxID=44386 RepID=A0A9J6FNR2_HAELO|nr:hypothetical protein HPB48_010471 [Haemaphysalis longicornis]